MKKKNENTVPIKKCNGIKEQTELERLKAEVVRGKATIDYIAMMTDVELPTEESEGQANEQEI